MGYIISYTAPEQTALLLRTAGCCLIVNHEILLIRRALWRTLGGEYEIPGGKLEPEETPRQAAVRETYEETSIAIPHTALHYVGTIYTAPADNPTQVDYECTLFLAHLTEKPTVILEPGHTDALWATQDASEMLPCTVGTREIFIMCRDSMAHPPDPWDPNSQNRS